MAKNNPVFLGLLILLFVIVVYFLIFKRSSFGATSQEISTFVSGLTSSGATTTIAAGSTSRTVAGRNWVNTFSPSGTNLTRYSSSTTTLPADISTTNTPFLLYDPGWDRPSSNTVTPTVGDTYFGIDYNNILGAKNTAPNAGSISARSVLTPVIGWAASNISTTPLTPKTYSYSPTCLSAIPNPYTYSSSSTPIETAQLTVIDGYTTSICTSPSIGPSGTCGEYGAFNAYFQYDFYASAFMNNDTRFWPFTITSGSTVPTTISEISNLAGVTTYYTPLISSSLSIPTTTPFMISYSEAMGIPANAIFNNTVDVQGGYSKVGGTPGATMQSLNKSSASDPTITYSQKIRTNTILGVLIAMHSLMGGANDSGVIATQGTFKEYYTGILMDLKYYYNQYQYSGNPPNADLISYFISTQTTSTPINTNSKWENISPPETKTISGTTTQQTVYNTGTTLRTNKSPPNRTTSYPSSGIFISNNTLNAIYLTLMARDNWIKNQLNLVNFL